MILQAGPNLRSYRSAVFVQLVESLPEPAEFAFDCRNLLIVIIEQKSQGLKWTPLVGRPIGLNKLVVLAARKTTQVLRGRCSC